MILAPKLDAIHGKTWSFPGGTLVKSPPARAGDSGDVGLIPGSGRSLGVGNGSAFQYSCLENSTDRGAWGHKESDTTEHTHTQ